MVSLIIGAVLAACGLAFVLLPLLGGPSLAPRGRVGDDRRPMHARGWSDDEATAPGITAVDVLREIEFDRATGKLSDADYGTLKSTYTARALAELRAPTQRGRYGQAGADASNQAARPVCEMCTATSPPDAIYCMRCAHYLGGECPTCHGPVKAPAAQYCSWCGAGLAARDRSEAERREETTAVST